MTISAKIVADSISNFGKRITTMVIKYPRFIHSEFMTHRVFSRNASSSRAIPVDRMIDDVKQEIAKPIIWAKNQKGMASGAELEHDQKLLCEHVWEDVAEFAMRKCALLKEIGVHKSIANRLLEPFAHITTIVTATEWSNFFKLRMHEDSQPEFYVLATRMYEEILKSKPTLIDYGEWHLPYISEEEKQTKPKDLLVKLSAARCARVSYLTHDGKKPDIEKDLKLYDSLVGSRPRHSSPTEHQATPNDNNEFDKNFRGWHQHRADIEYKWVNK